MPIFFFSDDIQFNLKDKRKKKKWFLNVIRSKNKLIENINFIFCSEERILEINKKYLKHNYYTDIITFPYIDEEKISGDIFISIPTVKSNSQQFQNSFNLELNRVMVHGVLHLIGYNDLTQEEKEQMRNEENYWLNVLGKIE